MEHDFETCDCCGGHGNFLGNLGDYAYYRCRDCGMQFSIEGAEGNEDVDFEDVEEWEDSMTDAEADADTFASAGWGTDEDYGYYGDDGGDFF